jgi:uncharacterized protein
MEMDLKFSHQQGDNEGIFYAERGGERVGNLTYKQPNEKKLIITDTNVQERYRHLKVGHRLVNHVAQYAGKNNLKLDAECSFAKACLDESGGRKAA